jgi:outer membrane protein TolC
MMKLMRKRGLEIMAIAVTLVILPSLLYGLDKGEADKLADYLESVYQQNERQSIGLDSDATLDDYLRIALKNNPGLKAAFYGWKSELDKAGYAGALPDPMISYGHFIENVETRVGPQEFRIGLKQSFPWFGTLGARKDTALESANAAYKKYQAAKLRLIYQVKAAYYDLYYLGREIQLTHDNFELLKFWESVARTKYQVGQKAHPDVIKAQVELGMLEDRLKSLEDRLRPATARLLEALSLKDSMLIPVPDSMVVDESELPEDSLISAAIQNNPDLDAIRSLVEKEKAGIRLAGKSYYPSFTFGVDYIETGEAINPSLEESGKDPWIVSAGINIPIWFGKNKAKKEEAEARHRMTQEKLANSENHIATIVQETVYRHNDALRKVSLYRDGLIPKAEQSLNVSFSAYQAGETDFLNVLDAQRLLLDFLLKFEKAKTDLAKSGAQIEVLTGKELNTDLTN